MFLRLLYSLHCNLLRHTASALHTPLTYSIFNFLQELGVLESQIFRLDFHKTGKWNWSSEEEFIFHNVWMLKVWLLVEVN